MASAAARDDHRAIRAEPETSLNKEIGLCYDEITGNFSASITYFHTDYDDKILEIPDRCLNAPSGQPSDGNGCWSSPDGRPR